MKVKEIMETKELDAVLVTDILNVRYLTGFTGTTGVALAVNNKRYFITDFRYVSQAKLQVEKNGYEVIKENLSTYGKVGELLKENNAKRVGIENQSVTLELFETFKEKVGDLDYVYLNDYFLNRREIKEEFEIEIIKESIKIAEKALENTIPFIKKGVKESEIAARLEFEMRKMGAEKPSFDLIVASGVRSSLPHGVASETPIEEGLITIDYGCFYKGYASDITRTFYIGKNPSEKHKEIYEIVKEANIRAIKSIKPGMSIRELDKVARDYITEKGYGDYFGHGLGHGIGLQIHEYPGVSFRAKDKILEPGMIITIEPGIYLPDFGGVRIEDDVLITKDGYEVLTSIDKEFRKL